MKQTPVADGQRQRQRQAALGRDCAADEAVAVAERKDAAARQRAERAERDRVARERLFDLRQRLTGARQRADAAQIDFEYGCRGLLDGTRQAMERVEALQIARDKARRELECFEVAVADARTDPVVRGRR